MLNNKKSTLLNPEDIELLELLAKFGVVHDRHALQHLTKYNLADKAYTAMCRRLAKGNFIAVDTIYANQGNYLLLGEQGAKLMDTKAVKKLPLNTLSHDSIVLDLYFAFLHQYPDATIMSERELRFIAGVKVGDIKKVPDLLMNNKIALEVELTEKSHARLVEIINNYLTDTRLEAVHYYVKSKSFGQKLLTLSGNHKKMQVFLLDMTNEDSITATKLESDNNDNTTQEEQSKWHFDLDEYLATVRANLKKNKG